MTDQRERRSLVVDLRAAEGERRLSGYAAVFDQRTSILGIFDERIAAGAFADAIVSDDVRALFNHDPNFVLGRTPHTLRLREDDHGLHYDIDMPETQAGRDVLTSVTRGDVRGSSFGFQVLEDTWDEPTTRGQLPLRTITKVRLFDVSPVTFPAYDQTSVTARACQQARRSALARDVAESRWRLIQK